jgi:HK97 family phage major capsid protein
MFNPHNARAERHQLIMEAQGLLDAAKDSGKDLNGDSLKTFNVIKANIADLDARLARYEAKLPQLDEDLTNRPNFNALVNHNNGKQPALMGTTPDGRELPVFSKGESIAAHMKKETFGEQPTVSFGEVIRAMALGGGSPAVRAALSIGTDSAGGYTVPTLLGSELIDALRAKSSVFEAGARTVLLDGGKSTTLARIDQDPVASWRAENSDVAADDMTFGAVTLTPKTLAVIVTASRELIEDSLNLDEAIRRSFAAAFASELDRVALIGSGTGSEPKGVSKTAGIGSFAMGDNGAVLSSYDPFVEALAIMQTANAQDPTACIISPRTAKEINLLKDSTDQPLQRPKALENLRFLTTSKLPINETQGTSNAASRAVMGYFPDLLVGVRSQMRIEVLREKYSEKLQYGFLGFLRADVALTHVASFCNVVGIN